MSCVGVFRKVDLDENSYWVYTLTQTDNSEISSFFFCPHERMNVSMLYLENVDDYYNRRQVNSCPCFPKGRSGDELNGICKLPVVPLFWCNNKKLDYDEFWCGVCESPSLGTSYYICLGDESHFHKECVESPMEIRHPSHPFHSLRLIHVRNSDHNCSCCGISSHLLYQCTTCKFSMHPICAMRSIPLLEDHPKSHPHPLSFFPTQASLVCHFCGQINKFDPTYICIQCVFVIHKSCIGFPHVIRISRHHHRISFTASLPPAGKLSCRVCHQQIDNNYGAYSCNRCDDCFVHSECALNRKVWDGKDLDGVPEEDDMIDDGEPFKRIADGIILHPFHSHNMKLEISIAYDENKFCRGCSLPIYEGQFYSCMEKEYCEYILHESCANAPRMKRHPLHPFPLTLIGPGNDEGIFTCTVCYNYGTGFFYEHHTEDESFQLDLRCASITEPFEYQGHEHPLFLPFDPQEKTRCQTCDYKSHDWKLYCTLCDYVICFSCLNLPYKVRYRHDNHCLTIFEGKKKNDEVEWCEICEGKIEEQEQKEYRWEQKKELRFYRCDDCCTALHVKCLLGEDINMKPGNSYISFTKYQWEIEAEQRIKVRIHLNSSLSRPICTKCNNRCLYPIFFKVSDTNIFCSWSCCNLYQGFLPIG